MRRENLIASDVPAILKYTRDVYFIENEEIARLSEEKIEFFNVDGESIEKECKHIEWDIHAAEKGGYEHFMLKEMYEQPKTITDTFSPRIKDGRIVIDELGMSDEEIRKFRQNSYCCLRFCLSYRIYQQVYFRGTGKNSGRSGCGDRVPLPGSDSGGRSPCHYYQSVRRDSGYPGSTPYGKRAWRLRPLVL